MLKHMKSCKNTIPHGWVFDHCFTRKTFPIKVSSKIQKNKEQTKSPKQTTKKTPQKQTNKHPTKKKTEENKSNNMHCENKTVNKLLKAVLRPCTL